MSSESKFDAGRRTSATGRGVGPKDISSPKLIAILAAVFLPLLGGIAFAVHRENNPK